MTRSGSTIRRRRLAAAAAVATSPAWALAPAAIGHPAHQDARYVVERVEPERGGLVLGVVPGGVGKLELRTTGSTVASVLDDDGRPFLRVGPRGVEADAAAPAWYEANEPLGIARVPSSARPGAPARWRRVSVLRRWEWFDHRLHPSGRPVTRWAVPLVVDGGRTLVRGRVVPATPLELRLGPARLGADAELAAVAGPTPSLRLSATGSERVVVLGPDGEPLARVGPSRVQANTRSPAWVALAQYRNRDLLASVVDPRAQPAWVTVGPTRQLIWPDPRLVARGPRAAGPTRWTIPVRVRGARREVTGETLAARTTAADTAARRAVTATTTSQDADDGGGGTAAAVVGAVAAAAVAAVAAGIWRRRRRQP